MGPMGCGDNRKGFNWEPIHTELRRIADEIHLILGILDQHLEAPIFRGTAVETQDVLANTPCPWPLSNVFLSTPTVVGFYVLMFHITQLLGISSPTEIWFGDVKQIPKKGHDICQPLSNCG